MTQKQLNKCDMEKTQTAQRSILLTEVLSFRRGDNLATVVTDGTTHRTYELGLTRKHSSLNRAIAYLEAKGYAIEIDKFNAI